MAMHNSSTSRIILTGLRSLDTFSASAWICIFIEFSSVPQILTNDKFRRLIASEQFCTVTKVTIPEERKS